MFSSAKVEEGGHSIPDWNSGNTGVPMVTLLWPGSPGKEKGTVTFTSRGDQVQ